MDNFPKSSSFKAQIPKSLSRAVLNKRAALAGSVEVRRLVNRNKNTSVAVRLSPDSLDPAWISFATVRFQRYTYGQVRVFVASGSVSSTKTKPGFQGSYHDLQCIPN